MHGWRSPFWLPGGHAQTIWAALMSRDGWSAPAAWRRERWDTPDGDFIDVDFLDGPQAGPPTAPLVVLFHGLEGSSDSPYARALASVARRRGLRLAVPHFRGCSGELNRAPRAYHSGDFEEVGWILQRLRRSSAQPLWVMGVSLGGNALLRWAQEAGEQAGAVASAVAAVSAPLDLSACGDAIDQGVNRLLYARNFLKTMKPRALAKWAQFPGLFDATALREATTLYAFDNVFTAPLHGFKNTDDYWQRASSKPHLHRIRVPALVLNARNDPFVPARCLPQVKDVGPWVTLWQPAHGGHCGFAHGHPPGHLLDLPRAVLDWMASGHHPSPKYHHLHGPSG